MSAILRKYATASTVNFPLIGLGVVNFTSTATLTTADLKISVDGGAFGTVGTAITNVGSFGYSYSLTTANLTGKLCTMVIISTAATKVCEDSMILIETYGNASAQHVFDFSVANQTVVASAGTVTVSAGTITSVTNSVNIVPGALVNASTVGDKTGYSLTQTFPTNFADLSISVTTGGVKIATAGIGSAAWAAGAITAAAISADVSSEIWSEAAVEPTGVPAVTVSMLSSISWLLALSRNKITQTSVLQTVLADNTANTIAASTISDDGTVFIRNEFT